MESKKINPWSWQDQFGFSQAIQVTGAQRMLFCSGQTSSDARGNPTHVGDMRGQVGMALDNLEAVLSAADLKLPNVVRLNYYTIDVEAFFGCYDVILKRLAAAGCQPSSTVLGIVRLASPELLVEIEATAVS